MDFNALLEMMFDQKASDLFITAGRAPSMKVDGRIQEVSKSRLTPEQSVKLVRKDAYNLSCIAYLEAHKSTKEPEKFSD